MNRTIKIIGLAAAALGLVAAAAVAVQSASTESDITAFEDRVAAIAAAHPSPRASAAQLASLPAPVQRYFAFVFDGEAPVYSVVRLSASGDFRRPLTETFNGMSAAQVIAAGVPALMFSGTTSVFPGVWARAYDYFAEGRMEMKAKIFSAVTVVDERETPELNRISLRRWLLESALYPVSLLPGGPVTWEPVDEQRARAVVRWNGMQASMLAHFDERGRMTQMVTETDGDLATPYHGSGEHVARSDYQRVGTQMIPMAFTISRMAKGVLHPFFKGRIESIAFE